MGKKIIALGNMVMCDTGICIKVAEFLNNDFRLLGFETLIGETDLDYSINKVEAGDFLIILDSSYYDIEPGTLTLTNIIDIDTNKLRISQYGLDFLKLLDLKSIKVGGFLLTIEICEMYFTPDLSPVLESKFHNICKKCIETIKNLGEENHF